MSLSFSRAGRGGPAFDRRRGHRHAGHSSPRRSGAYVAIAFQRTITKLASAERVAEVRGSGLHQAGEMEQTLSVFGAEIARGDEVLGRELWRWDRYGLWVV